MIPRQRPRLRKLIVVSLACWMVLLSAVVALHGHLFNEYIEERIWESMLGSEMTYIKHRIAQDPAFEWSDLDVFQWYDTRDTATIPSPFGTLPAGMHDEIRVGDRQFVVMVEADEQGRRILALDITDLENRELATALTITASVVFVASILTLLSMYSVGRLLRPLTRMADDISKLRSDGEGRRIVVGAREAHETFTIAEAINGFSDRIREHVERERNFINMASHELRTPIAVVAGVNEVVLDHPEATPEIRKHLLRSKHIVDQMGDLVTILLALARAPDTLAGNAEHIDVRDEVPGLIADHSHLCQGKDLSVVSELQAPIAVVAPRQIVRIAIGNLLRNAIENSERGTIRICSSHPESITIEDSGRGMSARETSEIYTRMAKSGQRRSGGIGLDLIARICLHFGWRLEVESKLDQGTRVRLEFGVSTPPAPAPIQER